MAKVSRKITKQVNPYGMDVNPITGEKAPEDYKWCRNAMSGDWFLEHDKTSFFASPCSETYWCS
jgi:hypothetical protein